MTKSVTGYLLESLRGLGQRRPSKQSLQERIAEVLEKSPMAADRSTLDAEVKKDGG